MSGVIGDRMRHTLEVEDRFRWQRVLREHSEREPGLRFHAKRNTAFLIGLRIGALNEVAIAGPGGLVDGALRDEEEK